MRTLFAALAVVLACHTPHAAWAQDALRVSENDRPLTAYVDSAALHAALAGISPPASGEITPVFTVEFGPDGALVRIEPFRGLDAAYAGAVVRALTHHVRPQRSSGASSSIHLHVVAGPSPRIAQVEAAAVTPPAVSNMGRIAALLEDAMRVHRAQLEGLGGGRTAVVDLRVLENGRVEDVRIVTSTGSAVLDREALKVAARVRFRPAMLNGRPVPARAVLPLRFQF